MQGAVAIDYIYGGICGGGRIREIWFPAETQRRRGKRRERILRMGGGFILRPGAGRNRAPPGAVLALGRGRVRRWGGSAGVGRGGFRREMGPTGSTGAC